VNIKRYNYSAQFGPDVRHLLKNIERLILEGRYILTDEVRSFELDFAAYLHTSYAVGVGSGTDALITALLTLGIKPGDEVVTHANTFHATVAAIRVAGATPVLVDADEESFLINEAEVAAAITPKTRVLIPVHLYGKPTPLGGLMQIAAKHGLYLVEDAAQAHGARINGQSVGTLGAIGCFSFHPSKNLAAGGDGGALVTNDKSLARLMQFYRQLGQDGQNNHVVQGINSKLDAIQALILSWKLPNLDSWNKRRREVAAWYRERLVDMPLRFQSTSADEEHAYHLFQIRTARRDQLLQHLLATGIDVVVRYPTPIHLQRAFQDCGWRPGQYPVAERLARELLCLPIRPDMSLDEVEFVTDTIRSFFKA
jgi:dTDP-4-amino-4,6-dideoxygalactose transaminase